MALRHSNAEHGASASKNLAGLSTVNWALLDQAMISGANFVLGLLLVRYIGLTSFGEYVLVWMIVQFCMSIQNALIISPMYSIAAQIEPHNRAKYYSVTIALQLLLAGTLAILPVLYVAFVPIRFLPIWLSTQTAFLLSLCIFVFQIQDYCRRQFCSTGQYRLAFFVDLLAYGIQLLFIVVVIRILPLLSSVLIVFFISMTISSIIAITYLGYQSPSFSEVVQGGRRHWTSAKWLLGSACLQWVTGNYFLVTAGAVMGPAVVGAIRAAQNLVGLSHILFQAFENIVPKEASRKYYQSGKSALNRYMGSSGAVVICGTASIAVLASWYADILLVLIYKTADPISLSAMYWFVAIYVLIAAQLPLRAGLRAIEKTKFIFIAYVATAVFSLVSARFFVIEHSVSGIMLGILIVEAMMLLIFFCGVVCGPFPALFQLRAASRHPRGDDV